MLDVTSFCYSVLLIGVLVQLADWIAPYHDLTEAGCNISYVYDGDTVALTCNGAEETARLIGFDTPEVTSPGCDAEAALGQQATLRLRQLIAAATPTVSSEGFDRYGRRLVDVAVSGRNVGDTMIAEGLAVAYDGGQRIDWCNRLGAQ